MAVAEKGSGLQTPFLQWREGDLKDASLVIIALASCSCCPESGAAFRGGYLPPKIIKLSLRNLKSSNCLFWGSTRQMVFYSPLAASATS